MACRPKIWTFWILALSLSAWPLAAQASDLKKLLACERGLMSKADGLTLPVPVSQSTDFVPALPSGDGTSLIIYTERQAYAIPNAFKKGGGLTTRFGETLLQGKKLYVTFTPGAPAVLAVGPRDPGTWWRSKEHLAAAEPVQNQDEARKILTQDIRTRLNDLKPQYSEKLAFVRWEGERGFKERPAPPDLVTYKSAAERCKDVKDPSIQLLAGTVSESFDTYVSITDEMADEPGAGEDSL